MPSTSVEGSGIGEICPICDGQIVGDSAKCPSCGFPTALLSEARKAIEEDQASSPEGAPGTVGSAVGGEAGDGALATPEPVEVVLPLARSGPTPPPASAASLNMEQTAVALQASLRVAQLLGMETTEVASALTNAAMAAARGAMDESLKVLQDAYDHMEPEISKRFESQATQLEEQEGRLREEGIAADIAREVSRARRSFEEGARLEGVDTLLASQRALNELEQAWKQVKETLLRVDTLRDTGRKLGMDLSKADERLGQVRETLAEEHLTATTLQEAGTQASAALVLLHEQVRNQIALLGQQAIRSLKAHPPPPGRREKAEARLKAILGHARAGRLKEASDEMIQFQALFLSKEEAEAKATPPPQDAEVPPEPPVEVPQRSETPPPVPRVAPEPSPAEPEPPAPVEQPPQRVEERPEPPPAPSRAPPKEEERPQPRGRSRPAAAEEAPPPAEAPPVPERTHEPEAAPARAASPRNLTEIITEARDLGLKVRDRQKKKKSIGNAAVLLKEITILVKAGKAAEAEEKLKEIRAELEAN